MVWFRVWVLEVWFFRFCVMTWFNGLVEFWEKNFLYLMGKWWVWGYCD